MQLLLDYLPVLFFFGAYIATKDIFVAVMAIMIVAPIVLGVQWLLTRKLNKMTAISTALVIAFGGITLLLDDPVFFYWKPTALYWAFALVCLASQFIGEKTIVQRMMQAATQGGDAEFELSAGKWRTLNLMWVVYSVIAGAANIYVAYAFSEETWVKFKLFGLLGLTVIFLVVQSVWLASVMDQTPNIDSEPEG